MLQKTCLSEIHLDMASAPKPTRWMSMVSIFLGFPLAGKCMKTGAEFSFMTWNTSGPSSKSTMAKNILLEKNCEYLYELATS